MRPINILPALMLLVSTAISLQMAHASGRDLVQEVSGGCIEWGRAIFSASGDALTPSASEEPNSSKAYIKAKGHARTKAIANILFTIDFTPANYAVTCRELMSFDDGLRQSVESLSVGAEIVSGRRKQRMGETIAEVTVELPMYGPVGPGTALLRGLIQQERLGRASAQVKIQTPRPKIKAEAPGDQAGPFTALIVDARGFGLREALNPRIRRPDGSEVWGSLKLESSLPVGRGVVAYYSSSKEAAKSSIAGRNPLIVRAVGRGGGPILCDAVVTIESADRMAAEDKASHFLRDYRVIFVVDSIAD